MGGINQGTDTKDKVKNALPKPKGEAPKHYPKVGAGKPLDWKSAKTGGKKVK